MLFVCMPDKPSLPTLGPTYFDFHPVRALKRQRLGCDHDDVLASRLSVHAAHMTMQRTVYQLWSCDTVLHPDIRQTMYQMRRKARMLHPYETRYTLTHEFSGSCAKPHDLPSSDNRFAIRDDVVQ